MENKEKQMPSKEISVKIGTNEYTIKFPKNGQLIDIESTKIRITNGTSKEMPFGSSDAVNAYITTCAIATFEVLLPEMMKDLNVGSLLDLDQLQLKPVIKAYETYYKWMAEWREFLNDDIVKE